MLLCAAESLTFPVIRSLSPPLTPHLLSVFSSPSFSPFWNLPPLISFPFLTSSFPTLLSFFCSFFSASLHIFTSFLTSFPLFTSPLFSSPHFSSLLAPPSSSCHSFIFPFFVISSSFCPLSPHLLSSSFLFPFSSIFALFVFSLVVSSHLRPLSPLFSFCLLSFSLPFSSPLLSSFHLLSFLSFCLLLVFFLSFLLYSSQPFVTSSCLL